MRSADSHRYAQCQDSSPLERYSDFKGKEPLEGIAFQHAFNSYMLSVTEETPLQWTVGLSFLPKTQPLALWMLEGSHVF